jgi:hypothetical protein
MDKHILYTPVITCFLPDEKVSLGKGSTMDSYIQLDFIYLPILRVMSGWFCKLFVLMAFFVYIDYPRKSILL